MSHGNENDPTEEVNPSMEEEDEGGGDPPKEEDPPQDEEENAGGGAEENPVAEGLEVMEDAVAVPVPVAVPVLSEREQVLEQYRQKIREHREVESRLKRLRLDVRGLQARFQQTEDDLTALQSVGQIIGDVLKPLDNKSRSNNNNSANNEHRYIVKASSGPRYVVGGRTRLRRALLKPGTRVALDMTTLTIMRLLPREVDPTVFHMQAGGDEEEGGGGVSFADIGGLNEQIRELREVIELPLTNPELFLRVGIPAPKGVLLYGPPGTGKTLLARALASNINATFLKVVASAIVDKYIGESARVIREMFAFARDHEPCVIFMDEIDAIGGSRFSEGTSADREIQRTLMELLNQMDGFESQGQVKMVMATNRPDILDPALLRPGRLDRKIEIPEPNESQRLEILKIHARNIAVRGEIDYESVVKLADGLNGADMRNVCTEAGLFAIRNDRDYVLEEDFMKAARKILDNKKLESKLDYSKV
jgi:26S proteasome regulatory subunit T4